jgi:DNA-binding HxlR family transcriptional regulator
MDPMDVYNAIVRLGGARLDQLVDELKPASQSTISRLIRRLVNQEMIHRIGYEWFPRVRDLTELGSGAGTQLSQVSQVKQNDVVLHPFENPVEEGCPNGELASMEDEHKTGSQDKQPLEVVKGSWPIVCSQGQEPSEVALAGAGPQLDSVVQDQCLSEEPASGVQVRPEVVQKPKDMYSVKTNPEVLRHIVLKVRKSKSRHNRGEGAKSARAMAEKKYYKMKLVPKDTIEDMRDLADIISRAVAHGQWWENEARLVKEMNRLIPDWRCGYKKALRDLSMIPLVEEEEETVYSQPDLTDATLWSERQEIAV